MAWEWVGPLATGTIGTVTISTTIWLAHKTFHIQNERAMKAERRALYGRFLKFVHEMEECAIRIGIDIPDDDLEDKGAATDYRAARSGAIAALVEISIVSPSAVEELARQQLDSILRTDFGSQQSGAADGKAKLLAAMRKDAL
jgi:hypothetical protein